MRKLLIITVISIISLLSKNLIIAQDCTFYFPNKQGAEIEMKSFTDKDKVTSISKSKVVEFANNSIKIHSEVFDQKEKPLANNDYTVSCKNGEFVMNMGNYMSGVNMDAYKDMDVKMETKDMHMPSNLKPGDVLDDGQLTMKVTNNGFPIMTMMVKVYNRKVAAIEKITTPAGTFECAKITYDVDSKTIFSISAKGAEWIAKNVGVVRSESYSSKGKLNGYTLLTAIK
jgi:hypothetical protein